MKPLRSPLQILSVSLFTLLSNLACGQMEFESMIYQGKTEEEFRLQIVKKSRVAIERIKGMFELSQDQILNLTLAADVDVERFLRVVEKAKLEAARIGKDQILQQQIWQDLAPLQQRIQLGVFDDTSISRRVIKSVLTPEQLTTYLSSENDRKQHEYTVQIKCTVATIDQQIHFSSDQRAKLLSIMLDHPPPKKIQLSPIESYIGYLVLIRQKQRVKNEINLDDLQEKELETILKQFDDWERMFEWE